MIRKIVLLVLMAAVFAFTAWNFYAEVLRRQPGAAEGQPEAKEAAGRPDRKYVRGWSTMIRDKNLFSPERTYREPKPVPVVAPKPVEPPPKRPEVALKGIVLDTFGDYVGYIEINQSKPVPVRKGDKVEDVEVVDVQEKKVMLQWMSEQITLSMDKIKTIKNPKAGVPR